MTDLDPIEAALSDAQREAWRACRAPGDMPVIEFAEETGRVKGTVGNHLARAEDNLADAADEFAAAATPVEFETECERRSTSWARAAPMADATEIRKLNSYAWAVRLPDGQRHVTALLRREDWFAGWCDCKGFTYNGGPCAHLCTLRQAAFVHVESDDGDRVTIPEQPPKTPATDGGRVVEPAAGSDGREFGRPEGRL
ncbi:SWIM zinc finger family protein [Halobacterium sp. NMX12-1]|uniref:SWIM zinc finger family protein n=1 Tax=Halobacterium sp. NMX12-1 TaxID=3166650 RepID=A0AAU8CFR2_9EURY